MPDGTCRGTDLAIGPHPNFVPNPFVLHPGPPPSNIKDHADFHRPIFLLAIAITHY
ncbi:hypothetical protein RhiirA1_455667 [Rhizophagus irregularis]|uniref:Uncharacterized protein n=1 Tax=Rhizophagus irregularis TaxID=588596 RepID=A0A2N0S2E8_9GLOM|nr:hypothetical protein RhiirA1_455667 [Rhizophagus irregularis]